MTKILLPLWFSDLSIVVFDKIEYLLGITRMITLIQFGINDKSVSRISKRRHDVCVERNSSALY